MDQNNKNYSDAKKYESEYQQWVKTLGGNDYIQWRQWQNWGVEKAEWLEENKK
jgi:hypothetical protein